MIGSLIFYGLYPLTRFINHVSESLTGCPSLVSINGKDMWDGGDSGRSITKPQAALLDRWLSTGNRPPNSETAEVLEGNDTPGKETRKEVEKKSTMKDDGPEKARDEPVLTALGPKAVAEMSKEGGNGEEGIRQEALQQQDPERTNPHAEELQRYVDLLEAPCDPLEECENGDLPLVLTSEVSEVHNPPVKEGVFEEITSDLSAGVHVLLEQEGEVTSTEESLTKAQVNKTYRAERDNAAGVCLTSTDEEPAEIWDSGLDLVHLLCEAQSQPWEMRPQPQPKGWHFPIGPGLERVVFCPSTSFPGISYYPETLERGAFDVVWRMWEDLSETQTLEKTPSKSQALFDFTVMSYNILSQDLLEANQELYTHCPLEVLSWDYRFPNLMKEFQKWEPDILCLQEVQENHFNEHLHPALRDMGYSCVYKRRTGTKTDGCAVGYRGNRFTLVSESLLEFYQPDCEVLDRDNVGVVLLLQPITTQGSEVAAISHPLCVAATHLLFNPRRGDVKLAQLATLIAEIDCVSANLAVKGESCDVVLCGDFNALPNMPLYQLITTRQLYYHGLPAWMISGQEDLSYQFHQRRVFAPLLPSAVGIGDDCRYTTVHEPTRQEAALTHSSEPGNRQYDHDFLRGLRFCQAACVRPQDLEFIPGVTDHTPGVRIHTDFDVQRPSTRRFRRTLSHHLDLQSAYGHLKLGTGRPEVTTLHSEVGATVDYIFYSPRRRCSGGDQKGGVLRQNAGLKLLGRLALLSEEDLWSMKGLPNYIFPSDHLSLLARFQVG